LLSMQYSTISTGINVSFNDEYCHLTPLRFSYELNAQTTLKLHDELEANTNTSIQA